MNSDQTHQEQNELPQVEIEETTNAELIFSIIEPIADWLVEEKGMSHWKSYYSERRIEQKIRLGTKFFIAKQGEEIVGICAFSFRPPNYYKEEFAFFPVAKKPVYFGVLGVLPDHQNKGIGKALVRFREEQVKELGADAIRFDARGDYKELLQFHKNNGFSEVGRVEDPADGTEYVLFEKHLNQN